MAGLLLAVEGFAVDDLVGIGRGGGDDALVDYPAGDVATTLIFGIGTDGDGADDVYPSRRAFQDNDLAAAADVGELGRIGAGRYVDDTLPHHNAALHGKAGKSRECDECDYEFVKMLMFVKHVGCS